MAKKSDEVKQEENLKNELDSILDDLDKSGFLDNGKKLALQDYDNLDVLEDTKIAKFMDFDKIALDAEIEAAEIVDSIVGFYIKDSMNDELKSKRYLFSKMKTDKMTISNLIFQMKTSEHAIKRLLEEIDAGNLHPRQFEVLAILQKSKMEIIKHLAFVQINMENNYKTVRQEQEHLYDTTPDEDELRGGFGSKGILNRLKGSNNDDITGLDDAEYEEI